MTMFNHNRVAVLLLLLPMLILAGCASTPLSESRRQFHDGNYAQSLQTLDEKRDQISDRDRLLVFMYKGLTFHQLGDYKSSNRELLKAVELIEELNRISVSEQLSTLAVNEWLAEYRGEYSEQLWVHTYLMMNFLLLGEPEGAAVEARRSLKVLGSHPKALHDAFFTRALIGLSFESVGLINDAYLEYKILAAAMDDASPVAGKLVKYATQLGLDEAADDYKHALPEGSEAQDADSGEVIVFLAQGDIPYKVSGDLFIPPDIRFSWPQYRSFQTWPTDVTVASENSFPPFTRVESDFGALASSSLSARGKTIATKQVARAVAKHSIVNEVEDNNPLVGGLLQIALFALEEADTRGWDILPGQLGMLRITLPAGEYDLELLDGDTVLVYLPGVVVNPSQKVFRKLRL